MAIGTSNRIGKERGRKIPDRRWEDLRTTILKLFRIEDRSIEERIKLLRGYHNLVVT